MSTLLAILYPHKNVGDDVMDAVDSLVRQGHLDLEDACVVVKDEEGRIQLHQENDLTLFGAMSGFAIGTFLGWFLWVPYVGAIAGAAVGALAGRLSDRGIPDNQMRDLGKEMSPGTSALFLLLRSSSAEQAIVELAPYGGRIFHTSLEKAQEVELEEMFEQRIQKGLKQQQIERSPEMHD